MKTFPSSAQQRPDFLCRRADVLRARRALDLAVVHALFEIDRRINALVKRVADLPVFVERQRLERQPAVDAQRDELARDLVRVAERQALRRNEVVGAVGRVDEALRRRGTENEEDLVRRLTIARDEIKKSRDYDYIVINDSLEEAADEILAILNKES